MRGTERPDAGDRGGGGSIPAGAGDGCGRVCGACGGRVYPRWCGGRHQVCNHLFAGYGLSPLVRGTGPGSEVEPSRWGSIPAGAGDGESHQPRPLQEGVYPRWCGGRYLYCRGLPGRKGLSPLVRGTVGRRRAAAAVPGSIPAGAGDGPASPPSAARTGVYPRWCGGRIWIAHIVAHSEGLSPLVRGTVGVKDGEAVAVGSIPAGAGDGLPPCFRWGAPRVYPRWCGGRTKNKGGLLPPRGLSPLVRGTDGKTRAAREAVGSIPAGAGDGREDAGRAGGRGVYPRWCGGRTGKAPATQARSGLSPLVRGTVSLHDPRVVRHGSIPAGAGDGPSWRSWARLRGVYPRWCGGRSRRSWAVESASGLSPLVRGTALRARPCGGGAGSIPAGAGDGSAGSLARSVTGSIPAGAGDGRADPQAGRGGGVYPRWCGGRPAPGAEAVKLPGLSPLVRGTDEPRPRV